MVFRCYLGAAAFLAGMVLLAGCKSPPSPPKPSGRRSTAEMAQAVSAEKSSAPTLEKIAQAHAHYATGVVLDLNGEPEAALDEFAKAALNDPTNESLVVDVSQRFLQRNQPAKALPILTNATACAGASAELYTRLGAAYSQLGKTDSAVEAYRAAIKKSPHSLAAYQNLFLLYTQNKQQAGALKVLGQAFKRSDTGAEFLVQLAELYTAYGRQAAAGRDAAKGRALAALDRAAKLNPTNPHLRLKLADGFNLLGETAKAVSIYTNLLEFYREFPLMRSNLRVKLADIFLRNNDRARATAQLEALVRDEPTDPLGYYNLGSIAFDEKKTVQAADYFAKAMLVDPEFERAYHGLARAQLILGQSKEALATLEKTRAKFGGSYAVEFLTGMAYARQKDYSEAIRHFTAAEIGGQASNPKGTNEILLFQLASAYERKGDIPQAEAYFRKTLAAAPDFAEALNYLGYMWADHGQNLGEARALIEKAVKLEPKNAAFLDSLGWVLFKLNRPREALDFLQKAIGFAEEPDATLYDHLGDVYAALGQKEKAFEAWRKSLSLEPNEKVQKKLGQPPPN